MTKMLIKFYVEPEQQDKLVAIKEREGIPVAEQIRRAIDLWLSKREAAAGKGAKRAKAHGR